MLQSIRREIALAIQAKSGVSPAVLIWLAIVTLAALASFCFFCVAGYAWLSVEFGIVFGGLIAAGFFLVVALIAAMATAMARRRVRERAILARAAKAHAPSWLLDPKILGVAVEAGRSFGWQRLVPVALLGFLAAQWAREYRDHGRQQS